jgi:hypothetical protein
MVVPEDSCGLSGVPEFMLNILVSSDVLTFSYIWEFLWNAHMMESVA